MNIIDEINKHNNQELLNDTIMQINTIKNNCEVIKEIISDNYYSILTEDYNFEIKSKIYNKMKIKHYLTKEEMIDLYKYNPLLLFDYFYIKSKTRNSILEETIIIGKDIHYLNLNKHEIIRNNNSENIIISKKEILNSNNDLILNTYNYYNFDKKENTTEKNKVYKNVYLIDSFNSIYKRSEKLAELLKLNEKELDKKLYIKNLRKH